MSDSPKSVQQLAQQLADARTNHKPIACEPYNALSTLEDAYQLQAQATRCYPSKQIGYKVGASSEQAQKLFDCNSPFYGPMFDVDCYKPGSSIKLRHGILGGEAEFAFLCGADFPVDRELTIDDLPALVSQCHIAVEIVGRRTEGDGLPSLHAAVADFGVNAAFMQGPEIKDWNTLDLSEIEVTAKTNGTETNKGQGSAVLGHPLKSLLWMHNALRANGDGINNGHKGLKAGDWVSTGTCLGVIKPVKGTVEIDFKGCGTISYSFS